RRDRGARRWDRRRPDPAGPDSRADHADQPPLRPRPAAAGHPPRHSAHPGGRTPLTRAPGPAPTGLAPTGLVPTGPARTDLARTGLSRTGPINPRQGSTLGP